MPQKPYTPQSDRGVLYFFDDFGGGNFDDRVWGYGGSAGGSVAKLAALGGQIRITVGAVSGNEYYIAQDTRDNYDTAQFLDLSWYAKIEDLTYLSLHVGFETDSTHYIHIRSDSTSNANWVCKVQNGASSTQVISSTAVDTNWHRLRIIGSVTGIDFFVDSTLLTTITTNIPTAPLGPIAYCYRHTGGSGVRSILVDWVEAVGARA
jgi:hypothetical protein